MVRRPGTYRAAQIDRTKDCSCPLCWFPRSTLPITVDEAVYMDYHWAFNKAEVMAAN